VELTELSAESSASDSDLVREPGGRELVEGLTPDDRDQAALRASHEAAVEHARHQGEQGAHREVDAEQVAQRAPEDHEGRGGDHPEHRHEHRERGDPFGVLDSAGDPAQSAPCEEDARRHAEQQPGDREEVTGVAVAVHAVLLPPPDGEEHDGEKQVAHEDLQGPSRCLGARSEQC